MNKRSDDTAVALALVGPLFVGLAASAGQARAVFAAVSTFVAQVVLLVVLASVLDSRRGGR